MARLGFETSKQSQKKSYKTHVHEDLQLMYSQRTY